MERNDTLPKTKELRNLLRQAMLMLPFFVEGAPKEKFEHIWNYVCKLVLQDDFYENIWDEDVLLQVEKLFQAIPPKANRWGAHLKTLSERTNLVKKINDFFSTIISTDLSVDEVLNCLCSFARVHDSVAPELKATNRLRQIRSLNSPSSGKVEAFIKHLIEDLAIDFEENKNSVLAVLESLRTTEKVATPKALLVSTSKDVAIVLPLQFRIQEGRGNVKCMVPGGESFQKAMERAKSALVSQRLLTATKDVECSLDLTEAEYIGNSIALPSAIGMYAMARNVLLDPYTAFTGDINLEAGEYKVKSVAGVAAKLNAALLSGCRPVFIPMDNRSEVDQWNNETLKIVPVDTILDNTYPIKSLKLYLRKVNLKKLMKFINKYLPIRELPIF